MASCASCKSLILFGGEKVEGRRFCNKKCLEEGRIFIEAPKIPDAEVIALAKEIKEGLCPNCQVRTGVELHKSYDIASFIFFTRYQTREHVCCRTCGLKKQTLDFFGSLLLGWWGVPYGVFGTPVQLVRNIVAMLFPPKTDSPSKELISAARLMIAQHNLDADTPTFEPNSPVVAMR